MQFTVKLYPDMIVPEGTSFSIDNRAYGMRVRAPAPAARAARGSGGPRAGAAGELARRRGAGARERAQRVDD